MRVLLVAAMALVLGAEPALAEMVKARRTANVYVRPGERSKVTTTVRAGKQMKVLGRKGRWLKVKVNGRVGWIVRTNIKSRQARAKEPKSNRRRRAFVNGRSRSRDLRRKSAPSDRYGLDSVTELEEDDDFELTDDGSTARPAEKKRSRRAAKKRARADEARDDQDEEDFEDLEDEDLEDEDLEEVPSGGATVVAIAEFDLRASRSEDAESSGFAVEGEKLAVLEVDGDWVKVETAEGDSGWVIAEKVRGDVGGSQPGETSWSAFGSLGYASFGQSFRSDSAMQFGNYDISSGAMSLSAAGVVLHDYSPDYVIGGELDFDVAIATPGIRVRDGEQVADTGFRVFDANLVAKGGYKLHPGTGAVAFARLGYRYQAFQISGVDDLTGSNLASLPSENLKGVVVGAELAAPRITDTIGGRAVLDTMLVLTSRSQTAGLEDGQVSRAKALRLGALLTYQWKPDLQVLAGYHYQWASTSWEGRAEGSMRKHDATSAERSDATHILSLGVFRDF